MDRREALKTFFALPIATTITRSEIRSHDLMVITAPGAISDESARLIKEGCERLFSDLNIRVIVLSDGLTVSIVREGAK